MKAGASTLLGELLGDIPPEYFFSDIWQKRPLQIKGKPDRFSALFDRSAFRRATGSCDTLKAYVRTTEGLVREFAIAPAQVDGEFKAGATICLSGIHDHAPLDRFIERLGSEILQAGEMSFNCYFSPDGQGFALHLDDHPVWILQIDGRKKWSFSATPFPNPLTTITFLPDQSVAHVPWAGAVVRPDESNFLEATLEPGDLLYLPEGTWHRAAADGESLALTLACNRVSILDLVQHALASSIAGHRQLRQNLGGFRQQELDQNTASSELEPLFDASLEELRGMVGKLTALDLYRAWLALARKNGRT